MPKLEVFFDYACPYCLRGHEHLLGLMEQYPGLEIEWQAREAHPRPERYGPHSDLCARGMYVAEGHGADVMKYHDLMYRAALNDRVDIEDLSVVSKLTDGILDSDDFYEALSGGAFLDRLDENNALAWETYDFPAVPSYHMNGELLRAVEGVGVSRERLAEFIEQNL